MKKAAAIAHFRQLCCLNLDSQTSMPTILQTLHDLIGSDSNAFYWSTQPRRVSNAYSEEPMPRDISALFYDEFLNNPKRRDSATHIGSLMRPGEVVGNSARLFPSEFYRSDNYNLVWRPLRRQSLLWAAVRDRNGNVHCVTLRRLVREAPFSQQDEQCLAQLVPYLALAVNAGSYRNDKLVDHGESGLIVVDHRGTVRYQCANGERLLLLATHQSISSGSIDWELQGSLPRQLRQLHSRLIAFSMGQSAKPPIEVIENRWGKFVFRTHHIKSVDNDHSLFGIEIQRHVPLALKLMENMRTLNLSVRQKEICLLLAQGKSHSIIAAQLNISPTTTADHVHKIYDKLNVHSHGELAIKLSEDEAQEKRR